jgi:hypothetical protein
MHAMRLECSRITNVARAAVVDDPRWVNGDEKKVRKHVDTLPRRD